MTQSDIANVLKIESAAQLFPWTHRMFESSLQAGNQAWVLTIEGRLIAYAVWREVLDEAELLTIAVDLSFQGQGYGKKMFSFMREKFQVKKIDQCFLEVAETNVQALNFYTQLGFIEIDQRKNYYQPGDVTAKIMRLSFNSP